jgi:hypothetical protein
MRIALEEIYFERIWNALNRRVRSVGPKLAWQFSSDASLNKQRLRSYKNKYKAQRCFLVANGPSLKKMDLRFLKDEVSFGLNRIYLAYDEMGFQNDFLVAINELVLEQFSKDISGLKLTKFLNWSKRSYFKNDPEALFICKQFFGEKFGLDISKSLNPAATVTYAALQIIYYMGFSEVIIIGMDHNFETKKKNRPNETEVRQEEVDKNHFHPNYFPKGSKWETPDLLSSEYFYGIARKEFEKDNREIFDCTVGGKCEVFKKINLSEFLIPA